MARGRPTALERRPSRRASPARRLPLSSATPQARGARSPLLAQARQIEQAKEANAQRRAQLSKVLHATAPRLPKRSTAALTEPEEFELMTARSDPGTKAG